VKHHVQLDIEGALKNRSFYGFRNEDGTPAHWKQVEKFLKESLAEGKVYLPMGDCEGFSFVTGCPGHETAPEGASDSP